MNESQCKDYFLRRWDRFFFSNFRLGHLIVLDDSAIYFFLFLSKLAKTEHLFFISSHWHIYAFLNMIFDQKLSTTTDFPRSECKYFDFQVYFYYIANKFILSTRLDCFNNLKLLESFLVQNVQ